MQHEALSHSVLRARGTDPSDDESRVEWHRMHMQIYVPSSMTDETRDEACERCYKLHVTMLHARR